MARVYYGLNVTQYLSEIVDKTEAIKNLGLDIRDLDVIRDISTGANALDKEDLRLISNLKSDARAVLFSLRSSTSFFPSILTDAPVADFPINNNVVVNSQLVATGYKYNYYDFNTTDVNKVKTADISTSRNSSWSSFERGATAPIFYGGDVEIIPSLPSTNSQLDASALEITSVPEPLIFAAQEPTHLIKITINGVEQEFYAMKGIPLVFDGFFRDGAVAFSVSRTSTQPRPSVVLEYLDNNQKITIEDISAASVNLPDFKARPKRLKFYYNPKRILTLDISKLLISKWTNVVLPEISSVNISLNDFKEMPNFLTLTPKLRLLNVSGNDLTRGTVKIANIQLQRLPVTIQDLNINGCFSDNTPINLSAFTNLRVLNFNSSYVTAGNISVAGKRMTSTGSTPQISPTNLITYNVLNQPYTRLHASVTLAENLENLNLGNTPVRADSNNAEISLASLKLKVFSSTGTHNLVNVNNRLDLTSYSHAYGGTLAGNKTLGNTFQGCTKLQSIVLYASGVEGNIGESFAGLPSLTYLDVRFTRITGKITRNTFKNSTLLGTLLIQGGRLGLQDDGITVHDQFFDNDSLELLPSLGTLQVIGNRNIRGNLPNLTSNKSLGTIDIQATNISGGLQSYSSLPSLRTLQVINCALSQAVPAFDSKTLSTIRLEVNRLTASNESPLPNFSCPALVYLSLNNNLLAGPLPSFRNCQNLQTLILSQNQFRGYTIGSFSLCTKLTTIDFSNCRLNREDIQQILADLRISYDSNIRTCRVNFLGNRYILSDILNSTLAGTDLRYLRSKGWSITI